jgi:hypothetical protein
MVSAIPASAFAQTASLPYQPRTQLELISYLQGVLATLQAQLLVTNNNSSARVERQSADVSSTIEVELSASFDAQNSSFVNAWFEYGVANVLDKKTSSVRIRNTDRNEIVEHVRILKNLEPNTAYIYRPVFELSNGTKFYGAIQNFGTTGGSVGIGGGVSGSGSIGIGTINSGRNSLSTDKTTYNKAEPIRVSWTTPKADSYRGNAIYMFEPGDSFAEKIDGRRIETESGQVVFNIYTKGTYVFRLYLDGNTRQVAETRQVTVR